MTDQKFLFLKILGHDLSSEDRPCNRLARIPSTNLHSPARRTSNDPRIFLNPSSISDCFTTQPTHWDQVTRGPGRFPSSPGLTRPGSARATRGPLASSGTLTRLGHPSTGPTRPPIRRSLDQFGHGPSACSTRISSAHKLSAGSGRILPSQTGCSGTLLPEKANGYKVLVGP